MSRALGLLMALLALVAPAQAADFQVGAHLPGGHLMVIGPAIEALQGSMKNTGLRLALVGDFISFDAVPELNNYEPLDSLDANLEAAWSRGVVPVVNLMRWPLDTKYPDNGQAHLRYLLPPHEGYYRMYAWARALRRWADRGEGRYMYLALFPEHNGPWTSYYNPDPAVYIEVFQIFGWILNYYAGSAVRLVWPPMAMAGYERYNPLYYHTVGVSLFPSDCGEEPGSYDVAVRPIIHSLQSLGRPILLAQTGTPRGVRQEAWAVELYTRLLTEAGVVGAMWWNVPTSDGCDLSLQNMARTLAPLDWRRSP